MQTMVASGIIMSIRPEHAFDIMSGRKTVELRRRFPEHVPPGSLILISPRVVGDDTEAVAPRRKELP